MYTELYNGKVIYHNRDEIGVIYYGDNLLWKKQHIRKYNFTHQLDVKYSFYSMDKVKLFKDYDNPELDRIRIEYHDYNMFSLTRVVDTNLLLMPTNTTYKQQVYIGGKTQINKNNKDIFSINDKNIVVHDTFGNYLGGIIIPLKGELNNILVDFDNNLLYVFLDKTYGDYSISKYSFKKDNFYSTISK